MLRTGCAGVATVIAAVAVVAGCGSDADTAQATPVTSTVAESSPSATSSKQPPVVAVTDWETVGTSVQGRPIRTRSVGHGPRIVLFVGGIHGDEAEGALTAELLPAAFIAAGLADAVTLTIMEDANPDGRAAGTRGNANGIDVNRNFPASNFDGANPDNGGEPLSQPESRALVETIDRLHPDLVMVAHSWAGDQFINFDGPAGDLAERFSASSGLPVEASSDFAPTPGSLGSYVGRDRKIPVLTIEVLKGSDPASVWEKLRPALLQAIAGT